MLYVKCVKSKKTGKIFYGLFADLGYRQLLLNYNSSDIAEFLKIPIAQLYELKENEKIEVK